MQVEKFQLGAFLKEKRTNQHLSSRDLAKRTRRNDSDKEIAASHINKIERGHVHPTFQTLQKIAAALGLPLIVVLDGSKAFPDLVTVVSASDGSRSLVSALNREKLVQLLLICQQFTDEQIEAVLTLVLSTSNAIQSKRPSEPTET